ncbi:DUF6894 family protein [Pararhizobium haloflavum]|uniref:DUF6894 family protein n=1 Tax=Pararhizobium haloflavum TaxID=2037914 RepID=UPI000C1A462E|nr:hypothetical protein [Pararhizobium haloflavum]
MVEKTLPTYYFEFCGKDGFVDRSDGIDLADGALCEEAVKGAKDLMREGISEGLDRTGWVAQIYDAEGELVLRFRFSDLLRRE